MAIRKVYFGSVGPFLYDDADNLNDPDGDFPGQTRRGLVTDGPIYASAVPTDPSEVARLSDITTAILAPVLVADISNPTELNALTGTVSTIRLCYQVTANTNFYTLYAWDSANALGVSSPYIVADSGTGFWIAIAGAYSVFNIATLSSGIYWSSATDVNNGSTVTMPTITANAAAHGFIQASAAGVITQSAEFEIDSTGTAQIIRASSGVVANADTGTNVCIGTAAAQNPLIFKNRLGSTQRLTITVWYS